MGLLPKSQETEYYKLMKKRLILQSCYRKRVFSAYCLNTMKNLLDFSCLFQVNLPLV